MRRLLSFISTKFFWVLIGLISISLLVWFVGPIVAIGDYRPLSSKSVRILVIALIFGLWLGKLLIKRYIETQRNKELVEQIKTSQEPILKHVKEDSPISQQFEEIDKVLKTAKFSDSDGKLKKYFSSGQYLYQMPWYVVIGAAGSGKTSVLRESGLNFPLESSFGASISGLAGTKDCDWFLTDEAVLLDTAGRLSLHDNGEEDAYDWLEFINLLKQYRPKQPINGVIVTVGTDDLLKRDNDLKTISIELRKRIAEMRKKFGIDFPVYLTVTKLDKLKGFNEFFDNLTEEERKRSLGFTIPVDIDEDDEVSASIGYVGKQLKEIKSNIEASYLRVIHNVETKEEKSALFTFSDEFSLLNEKLIDLFKELHKSSKFEEAIQWRGIYFTSATQNGENIDPVYEGLINKFKLQPKYLKDNTLVTGSPKSYFIHDFFEEVIFRESDLASKNVAWSHKNRILKWVAIGAMVGGGIIFLAYMFNSYLYNKEYLNNVNLKAEKLNQDMSQIPETKDLLQAVELANSIKSIPNTTPFQDVLDPLLKHRFGLYQGEVINEMSQDTYDRALREKVMPLISYKINELLRESADDSSIDTYNALKAYLMLYDSTKFDSKFMIDWLIENYEKTSSIQNEQQKDEIRQALKFILEEEGLTPVLPLDTDLIDRKRQAVARNDISIMILNDTFTEISGNKVKPISFDTMGGKQSRLIFERASGRPITETINPIYTKQAYLEYVLPELLKSTAKLYSEEEWVLGDYASLKTSQKETLNEAKRAYYDKYIAAWNRYISDIRLKQPRNLREARNIAKILSSTSDSPLKNLINGISENTTFNLKKQLEEGSEGLNNNLVDRLISRAGLSGVKSRLGNIEDNYLNTLKFDTAVDDVFSDFHSITSGQGNDTVLNDVILSVKDLYEFLDVLNIAVEKGVDLPSNDSLYRYRAEVNRLPSPFREMFDRFSVYILNQSLDEMNQRVEEARLKEEEIEEELKRELAEKERERERKAQEQAEAEAQRQEEAMLAEEQAILAQEQERFELKKKQELDAFINMKNSLRPITRLCRNSIDNRYPFTKTSNDLPLVTFNRLFSVNSPYFDFMQIDPEVKRVTNAFSFMDLLRSDNGYANAFSDVLNIEPIHQKYFVNDKSTVGFDLELEFVTVNPNIDKVVLDYGSKTYQYSHGPIVPIILQWPSKSKPIIELTAFKENEIIGSIKEEGEWELFHFVDKGNTLVSSKSKTIVEYQFDGNEVTVKFTPRSSNNPLKVEELTRFKCP